MIIGFGKAGKTLANKLGENGESTVLVEKSKTMYGGTCINIACIPTKFLLSRAQEGVPLKKSISLKNKLVADLRSKNYKKISDTSNVEVINGHAEFIDAESVIIRGESTAENRKIKAERIFINTGTLPRRPEIEGIDLPGVHDSTSIMEVTVLPKKMVIVGSGFIGLEFATIFAKFGSKVVILDKEKHFLANEDPDFSEAIFNKMKDDGINIIQGVEISKFSRKGKRVKITYSAEKDQKTMTADAVLLAMGRIPNLNSLKPENPGIKLDERGFVKVNSKLRTNIDHIWALGDINGGPQFTYISLDDYRIIQNQLFGGAYDSKRKRKDFATAVFTDPPFAHIGKRKKDLKDLSKYFIQTMDAAEIPKSHILGQTEGLLQAIIHRKTGKIAGCSLYCAESHEMINVVKTVMDNGLHYSVLQNQIFTHPTMSEGLNELFSVKK